jgi:hypothetical protein
MKLYIPEIGDMIVLTEDWTFNIYNEYRNNKLYEKMGWETRYGGTRLEKHEIMFPKGTSLKIDRIYIRKGSSDYSSITFYVGSGNLKGARFWAKLADVNRIEFDPKESERTITVSFPKTMYKTSEVGRVINSKSEYDNWFKHLTKQDFCKVNAKRLVEIRLNIESRECTEEECKTYNDDIKKRYHITRFTRNLEQYNFRETGSRIITKFEFEAYSLILGETGAFIGKAQNSSGLTTKIKKYFKDKEI